MSDHLILTLSINDLLSDRRSNVIIITVLFILPSDRLSISLNGTDSMAQAEYRPSSIEKHDWTGGTDVIRPDG